MGFLIPGSLVRVQPGVFFSMTYGSHSILDRRRGTAAGRRHASPSGITWEGWCSGLPMLRETALLTSAAMDGEVKSASSERRPGGPQRASGDGAWAGPGNCEGEPQVENLCYRESLGITCGPSVMPIRRKTARSFARPPRRRAPSAPVGAPVLAGLDD